MKIPFQIGRLHYAWVVVAAVVLVLMFGSGIRASFGVFIKPIEAEFGWDRVSLSTVAAVSLFLYGAIGPLVGRLADRWGPRGVLVAGAVLVSAGTLGTAHVNSLWQLYVTAGVITALGAGGAAMSVAASTTMRWFDSNTGLVIGIFGAGLAAGQLLIIPLAMALTVTWGWRTTFLVLGMGFLVLVMPLAGILIRNAPSDVGLNRYGSAEKSVPSRSSERNMGRTSIWSASRSLPFWLLGGSYWICGYTTSGLILTHLIPHTTEHGFSAPQAAQALGLMGALNIAGTIGSGWICDRFGPKAPLICYYLLRGLSLVFLPLVGTVPGLFAFAAVYGLNYISTVPATTALTARLYGRHSVGELSGWIFMFHQLGAAFGSVLGGYFYRWFGNYTLAFYSAAGMAILAAFMIMAIREKPAEGGLVSVPAAEYPTGGNPIQ